MRSVIADSYIYGVTVLKMLRSKKSGSLWYNDVFGFKRRMPKKLTIECVVAVNLQGRKAENFSSELRRFMSENSLQVGGDTIEFYLANYTEKEGSPSIDFKKG
jgi:hypothetical protein